MYRESTPAAALTWADALRDGGKRFVVRAEEKLTAFLELEAAIRGLPAIVLDEQVSLSQDWAAFQI